MKFEKLHEKQDMAEQATNGIPNWTIMMYMAAQNLLANFAVESLKQLKSAASSDVVVAAQLHADINKGIRRYTFGKVASPHASDASPEPEIMALGEPALVKDVDMADPKTLTEFLAWAYKEHKAHHYALVLWSEGPFLEDAHYEADLHAAGPGAKKIQTSRLMPVDLKKAIAESEIGKRGIEIVAMDACCVSMLEVACELRDVAQYMIASGFRRESDRNMREDYTELRCHVCGLYLQ
jgi:hypothetical protein